MEASQAIVEQVFQEQLKRKLDSWIAEKVDEERKACALVLETLQEISVNGEASRKLTATERALLTQLANHIRARRVTELNLAGLTVSGGAERK